MTELTNLNIGDRQHELSTENVRELLRVNPVIIPPSFGYPEMTLDDVRKAMTDADNCSNCGMANWYGIFEYILERVQEQEVAMNATTKNTDCPMTVYTVDADPDSGEWIGEPIATEETATFSQWCEREDTDTTAYEHYEHFDKDKLGMEAVDGKMRLIRIRWCQESNDHE